MKKHQAPEPFIDIQRQLIEAATTMAAGILKAEVAKAIKVMHSAAAGTISSYMQGLPLMTIPEIGRRKTKRAKPVKAKRTRRQHSDAFKAKVVAEAKVEGIAPTAKRHDLARSLIDKWLAK